MIRNPYFFGFFRNLYKRYFEKLKMFKHKLIYYFVEKLL